MPKKPKMSIAETVSIIISTKNEERVLGNLLETIKKQSYPKIEIILVDNNSTDRTKKIARKYTNKVFSFGPERSAQRNFGAKKAKGKHLLFLDADMKLAPKVVEECVAVVNSNPEVKALVIPEKSFGTGYWAKVKAFERSFYVGDETIEAARFFDKKAFFEFEGYDEKIWACEDWDLNQRIKGKYKIGRIKSLIDHDEGRLSLFLLMKKKYYYGQISSVYFKKHPGQLTKQQAIYFLRPAFYRNWKKLIFHPFLFFGMIIMLTAEMMAGGTGFLIGKLETKCSSQSKNQ